MAIYTVYVFLCTCMKNIYQAVQNYVAELMFSLLKLGKIFDFVSRIQGSFSL